LASQKGSLTRELIYNLAGAIHFGKLVLLNLG